MSVGDDDPVAASASGGFADRLYSFRPSGPKSKRTCPKRIFPVSALDNRRKARADELQLEDRWYPIQVKQTAKAGRPDIDAFEAMMAREECAKGLPRLSPAAVSPSARLFVSFDYTGDADPPTQAEMQAFAAYVESLRAALVR